MSEQIATVDTHKLKYGKHHEPIESRGVLFGLHLWELVALGVSIIMLIGVAMPYYFDALATLRGRECSNRLTLVANCLAYLAEENGTKPGEQICHEFQLNELLERVQGGELIRFDQKSPPYFKVGAEPDCVDVGDHTYHLRLGEDGKIIPPTCSLAEGEEGERNRRRGLHVCDMEQVNGKLELPES